MLIKRKTIDIARVEGFAKIEYYSPIPDERDVVNQETGEWQNATSPLERVINGRFKQSPRAYSDELNNRIDVDRSFENLSELTQRVLTLFREGYSVKEISDKLKRSKEAIYKLMERGLKNARQSLNIADSCSVC